jgi:hypothetical protein
MHLAQLLALVQDLDLELDRLRAQATALEATLTEPPALLAARRACEELAERMHKARRVQREREWDAREGQAKVAAVDSRLYGGLVTAAKELANLQRELDSLKVNQARLDERALEALNALEELTAAEQAAQTELQTGLAAWESDKTRAGEEIAAMQTQVTDLTARRAEQAGQVDRPSLAAYERLRPSKGGRAVARLQHDRCGGCRLILPSSALARARTSPALVYCINCGRILCR